MANHIPTIIGKKSKISSERKKIVTRVRIDFLSTIELCIIIYLIIGNKDIINGFN